MLWFVVVVLKSGIIEGVEENPLNVTGEDDVVVCAPKIGVTEDVVLVIAKVDAVEIGDALPPKIDVLEVVGCPLNNVGALNVDAFNGCTGVLFVPNIDVVLSLVLAVPEVDVTEASEVFSILGFDVKFPYVLLLVVAWVVKTTGLVSFEGSSLIVTLPLLFTGAFSLVIRDVISLWSFFSRSKNNPIKSSNSFGDWFVTGNEMELIVSETKENSFGG